MFRDKTKSYLEPPPYKASASSRNSDKISDLYKNYYSSSDNTSVNMDSYQQQSAYNSSIFTDTSGMNR